MAKNRKKVKKVAPAAPAGPAWNKKTWMSLANIHLGVPAFVVAGALHGCSDAVKLTEADVKARVEAFLTQHL